MTETKKIGLANGYAEIPTDMMVVDISDGGEVDHMAIIADYKHAVPPIAVVSDKSLCRLSAEAEDAVVEAAIKDLPEYQEEWDEDEDNGIIRLGLFPLEMFSTLTERGDFDCRIVREAKQ